MENYEFFASCLPGVEQLLASELKTVKAQRIRPLGGGVAFFGRLETAYRACLWSRHASRIMLVLGRVPATDADGLYEAILALPWEEILGHHATIAVNVHGSNAVLRNTRYTSLKVKDAICDRLRDRRGSRPDVDAKDPDALIEVRVHDQKATISFDMAGASLYQRPYLAEDDSQDAPLQCAQAAALLGFAGWNGGPCSSHALVDPACMHGEVVIEAALMAADAAPGLLRDKWGFEGWAQHDEALWMEVLDEADERFEAGLARLAPLASGAMDAAVPDPEKIRFVGLSASSPAISTARKRARRAGLRQVVSIESSATLSPDTAVSRSLRAALRAKPERSGCFVVSNLAESGQASAISRLNAESTAFVGAATAAASQCDLAAIWAKLEPDEVEVAEQSCLDGVAEQTAATQDVCRFAVAGGLDIDARFGIAPLVASTIGRDRVEQSIAVYDKAPQGLVSVSIPDSFGGADHKIELFEETSVAFASRLRKVAKERRKWAAREGVSCYRIYDADLPEYSLAIDCYEGAGHAEGNTYIHIAEYAAPSTVSAAKAKRRFSDAVALVPIVLGVRADHVFSKVRSRDKGGTQYRDAGTKNYVTQVMEDGKVFEVDLAGYLDTGLFLDHRVTRKMLTEYAEGARFLNLFAYTGSGTVYAACAGAKETVTVDLSQTYLDWAQRNMELNGCSGDQHSYERSDAYAWIRAARQEGRRFDLVFVDPPTFSNSKSMGKGTWDVQRDYFEMLIGISYLLAKGGKAIFSCNLRNFKIDAEGLKKFGVLVKDITAQTIPEDFARNPKIHKCYEITRDPEYRPARRPQNHSEKRSGAAQGKPRKAERSSFNGNGNRAGRRTGKPLGTRRDGDKKPERFSGDAPNGKRFDKSGKPGATRSSGFGQRGPSGSKGGSAARFDKGSRGGFKGGKPQ